MTHPTVVAILTILAAYTLAVDWVVRNRRLFRQRLTVADLLDAGPADVDEIDHLEALYKAPSAKARLR